MKGKVFMKGCAYGLGAYAAVAVLDYFVLRSFSNSHLVPGMALISSFFTLLLLGAIYSNLVPGKEERAIRQADQTHVPGDGEYLAAIGTIETSGDVLISPLTKKRCVIYEYEIYRKDHSSESPDAKLMDFSGNARVPCTIRTTAGHTRLFGFPDLDHFKKSHLNYEDVRANAQEYIARTTFSDLTDLAFGSVFSEVRKTLESEDREERKDRSRTGRELTPEQKFRERCVEVGQPVCALGIYSAERGGLVSRFFEGTPIQLVPGQANEALRLLSSKKKLYFVTALLLFLISHGILYYILFLSSGNS